jgi:methylase of polypeptide subunit release factors
MSPKKSEKKIEFGDFQTPLSLAEQVCSTIKRLGLNPRTVVEPTCGLGSFLIAAAQEFDSVTHLIGTDVNPVYVKEAGRKLHDFCLPGSRKDVRIMEANFFLTDWNELLSELPDPLLILGNPPWVTNSELASMNSGNLPDKRNFLGLSGIEAITGASNFDISEWMLLQMLNWVEDRSGAIAMLCKTAVARKVLRHSWKNDSSMAVSRIYGSKRSRV